MAEPIPFWQSISLEELAEQQGVSAVDDLDEIAALWPADDDPDKLLQHLLAERTEWRKLGESWARESRAKSERQDQNPAIWRKC